MTGKQSNSGGTRWKKSRKTKMKVVSLYAERYEIDGRQEVEEETVRQAYMGYHSEGGTA